jgi:hypothetical protein
MNESRNFAQDITDEDKEWAGAVLIFFIFLPLPSPA